MSFLLEKYDGSASVTLPTPQWTQPTVVNRHQPKARAGGGTVYVYTQGTQEVLQTFRFRHLTTAQVAGLANFIQNTANGSAVKVRYTNPVNSTLTYAWIENTGEVYEYWLNDRTEVNLTFRIESGWP